MDPRSSDKALKKGRLTPLSEHPIMDRLAEILRGLPPDRQAAFIESLAQDDTRERGTVISLKRDDKVTNEQGENSPGEEPNDHKPEGND